MHLDPLSSDHVVFPGLGIDLDIDPTAFSIFGFEIKWYGICIAIGLFLAMTYCFKRTKSFGLDGDSLSEAVFFGLMGAIIGARAYYVIFHIDSYTDIKQILAIRDGGLAIYGGIIGALILGCIVCKVKKIHILSAVDLASMGFFIGQACGRWGNFFNQECFGTNTSLPWGMSSGRVQNYLSYNKDALAQMGIMVDPYQTVHPCFLYESIWCVAGFLILHFFYKHRKFDGELICIYCAWYGTGRAVIEGLRTDSLYIGSFRASQLLAIITAAAAVVVIVIGHIRAAKNGVHLFCDSEEGKAVIAASEQRDKEEKERSENRKKKALDSDQHIIDDTDDEEDSDE
ncbi:MAG: prolipoprotein diacylglyceryl transferase [Oscillospiraceae bacterium]|nr:prolipoprotein diacylglyceryl transferase [Oscillospiraceae bacterium]